MTSTPTSRKYSRRAELRLAPLSWSRKQECRLRLIGLAIVRVDEGLHWMGREVHSLLALAPPIRNPGQAALPGITCTLPVTTDRGRSGRMRTGSTAVSLGPSEGTRTADRLHAPSNWPPVVPRDRAEDPVRLAVSRRRVTANMTAKPADVSGRGRTIVELRCSLLNGGGC